MPSQDLAASMESFVIGIIGMGDMGKLYAKRLSDAGWR
jgi:prephenate dehydrogenase (NADP+)